MSLLANDPNQQSNNYTTIVDEVWMALLRESNVLDNHPFPVI